MPDELLNGTIDVSKVHQLICGYQVTALVMEDGQMYMWGNNNAMLSLPEFTKSDKYNTDVEKVAFSNYYAIIMRKDGTVTGGQTLTFNMQSAYSNKDGEIKNLRSYMTDRTVLDIAATNNCYAFIMDDGSIVVFGAAEYGEKDIPVSTTEEKMVSIYAGTRHFVAVSESGKVYTWGHNDGGQCDVAGATTDHVFVGAKQTYLVNAEGELIGINFDRVWEGTMSDIVFDPEICRNIALDIRYALFIIDKIAGAGHLIEEMTINR